MNRIKLMFALALMVTQTIEAQEVTTMQQDSLLQVMNDTTYWKTLELDEVVVKSNLPKTRVKGDAMRTLVSGSILEKAGSTTDLLNKIPTLKAAKGGGVEVFGRGAAEVYINGRKVQDMNELDRLRSEDILHVDVVHNPGARYAASTKAVVRITMKKRQGEGFSFTDNAGGMYKYGATATNNLDVNYRTGGLDITASMWAGRYAHTRSLQENDIYYQIGNDNYVGRSKQDHSYVFSGYSPQLQLNYIINENHSFGAFYKWDHNLNIKTDGWFLMENEKNGSMTESMLSDIAGDGSKKKHIFNAYYNGKIGNLSVDWNVDGLFNTDNDWTSTKETTRYVGTDHTTANSVKNNTLSSNNFWATKLILSYPLWGGNMSAGTEYSHNSRNSIYKVNSKDQLPLTGSDTDIKETSVSGYAEYGRAFGNLFAQAGIRYEHLSNGYYDFGVRRSDVSRSYGDWFPTLTLAYHTPQQLQLSLSYRKDIDRPQYDNLRSSVIYINKYSYQGGNPYLSPVYTHNLSLNVAYRWANAGVIYQRIENDIVLQTKPYPGSTDPMVSIILPENSSDAYNRLNINLSARPVFGMWHPSWWTALILQNYKSLTLDGTMTTLNRPYMVCGWDNDIVLPHDWRINAQVQVTTKGDYMTYRMLDGSMYSSLGVQKDLITRNYGKFTFDMRCHDPFNLNKSKTCVYGIRQIVSENPARRLFSLDVTWRFNEAQKKYRGSGAGESQKKRM